MPSSRDPYLVLGIPRNADACEIKRAYRRLVLELHPDITGDATSAPSLLEVQRAYQALTEASGQGTVAVTHRGPAQPLEAEPLRERDDPSPLAYSEWRHGLRFHPEPFASADAEFLAQRIRHVFSVVDELFQGFVPEVFPDRPASEPKDLYVEIVLTRDEARYGGTWPLTVPVQNPCRACLGSGLGGALDDTCRRCGGRGYHVEKKQFEVVVPRDVKDGQETSIPLAVGSGSVTLRVAVKVV